MKIRICFTGGGTAGHVYPGIAVLDYASVLCSQKSLETDFYWIGGRTGMERKLVKAENLKFYGISTGKLRRYFSFRNFTDIFKIAAGFFQSLFILIKNRPDIIFSKGGYVSVPPVIAGRLLGIRVVSHESDFTPGLATRINSIFSNSIFLSYLESEGFFSKKHHKKLEITGNPVRQIFITPDPQKGRKFLDIEDNTPVILVLGGSQGAFEINNLIEKIIEKLTEKYFVIHQFGTMGSDDEVSDIQFSGRYKRYPFFGNEIADILSVSDLVISRAGAGTLWEITAVGKPSILIPLRGPGTRGDQVYNADFMYSKGAAEKIDDIIIDPELLYNKIVDIINDREKSKKMVSSLKMFGIEKSAEIIAEKVLKKAGVSFE